MKIEGSTIRIEENEGREGLKKSVAAVAAIVAVVMAVALVVVDAREFVRRSFLTSFRVAVSCSALISFDGRFIPRLGDECVLPEVEFEKGGGGGRGLEAEV